MLDLDKIIKKSYQVKINGELINVNQPTLKMVREYNSSIMSGEEVDIFEVQSDFALKVLNNNSSAKKFSKADIENLPTNAVNAIIETIANGVNEAEKDPN